MRTVQPCVTIGSYVWAQDRLPYDEFTLRLEELRAAMERKRRVFFALVPPILMGVLSVTRTIYGRTSSPSLVMSALDTASRP